MNCVMCETDEFIDPEGLFDEAGNAVPCCTGCRETLIQITGPVKRPKRTLSSVTLEAMTTEELLDMAEELEVR